MKFIVIATFLLLGSAFAQEEESEGVSVLVNTEWPQNDHSLAGAIVSLVYEGLEDGSCIVNLPEAVNMFHVMNGHINGDSSPVEGRYKISAPAGWEAANSTFNVLIMFNRDEIFNLTDIVFTCDPTDVEEISVYSFPQNNLVKEASSNVYYTNGFHEGDVLTVTFPVAVARFNFTTMDSRYTVTSSDSTTFTLSGFQNAEGVDDMKEVSFSIDYLQSEDGTSNWFSAGDVTVTITREDESEE
uniref:uncharacterized protein LOC120342936 n=1 Tax=Styela clava TaxID=7725 RepID=UPI001939ECB6|nr:uncharacterized protein LOC120342936 [Styela clava]